MANGTVELLMLLKKLLQKNYHLLKSCLPLEQDDDTAATSCFCVHSSCQSNLLQTNFHAKATSSKAKATNSIANGTNSFANGTKSTAKRTNSIAKTCNY